MSIKVTILAGDKALTAAKAKELLGWTETEGEDFAFRDRDGKKIKLKNNNKNRPFRMAFAERYANEMLRKKWQLNGETIIFDTAGKLHSGQHRLVGLVLAEQTLLADPKAWKDYGTRSPLSIETILVEGILPKKEVADSLDGGQKRTLGDVLFRNHEFKGSKKEQQKLANIFSHATRLCWIRMGGKMVSDAPHFPHSEALDFIKANPKLQEACEIVCSLDGGSGADGKRISGLISLGYAAGLLYLMGTAKSKPEKVAEEGPEAISTTLWAKAKQFWTLFASGANLEADSPILILRNLLTRLDAGSGTARDEIVGSTVKSWNLWVDGEKADTKAIKVARTKDEDGRIVLAEEPRIGGLDVVVEEEEEEEIAEEKPKGKKAKKLTPKKDEWVWVKTEEDEEPWKGKVLSVDGESTTVAADKGGDEYVVPTEDVYIDKPEAA